MKTTNVILGTNYKGEPAPLCGNCHSHAGRINTNYCHHCGARLNWVDYHNEMAKAWKKYYEELANNEVPFVKETNQE